MRFFLSAGTASGPIFMTLHETVLGEPDTSMIRPRERAGVSLAHGDRPPGRRLASLAAALTKINEALYGWAAAVKDQTFVTIP